MSEFALVWVSIGLALAMVLLAVLDFVVGLEIQEAVFVYAGATLVIVASLEWILLMVGYWE